MILLLKIGDKKIRFISGSKVTLILKSSYCSIARSGRHLPFGVAVAS